MTRILLALLGPALLAAPATAAERRYSVTDFDRIQVEGPYIVRLTTGRGASASASGTHAALDRLSIDVQSQTLRIRRHRNYTGGNPGAQEGPLTIIVTTRTLRSARLIGPGSLEIDRVQGLRADLTVEGSGQLKAAGVAADTLNLGLLGAGRMELAGTAGTLRADVQGTGGLEAAGLTAQNATITSTTSGAIALSVARAATVNAQGLGNIVIGGSAACTVNGAGAPQVSCGRSGRR